MSGMHVSRDAPSQISAGSRSSVMKSWETQQNLNRVGRLRDLLEDVKTAGRGCQQKQEQLVVQSAREAAIRKLADLEDASAESINELERLIEEQHCQVGHSGYVTMAVISTSFQRKYGTQSCPAWKCICAGCA